MASKKIKRAAPLGGDVGLTKTSFELYLDDMRRHPALSPDETDALVRELRRLPADQVGSDAAMELRDRIVRGNQQFTVWLAKKTVRGRRNTLDRTRETLHDAMVEVIGTANAGLMEATKTYDPDFRTTNGQPGKKFVWWALDSHIKGQLQADESQARRPYDVTADVELKLSHLRQARIEIEKATGDRPWSLEEIAAHMNARLRERRERRERERGRTYTTEVHTYTVDELRDLEDLEAGEYSVSTDAPAGLDADARTVGETLADVTTDPDDQEIFPPGPAFDIAAEQLGIRDAIAYRLLHHPDSDGVVMSASAVQYVVGQHPNTIDVRMREARADLIGGKIEPVRDDAGRPQRGANGEELVTVTVRDPLVHERMKRIRNPEGRALPARGRVSRHF